MATSTFGLSRQLNKVGFSSSEGKQGQGQGQRMIDVDVSDNVEQILEGGSGSQGIDESEVP